MSARKVVLFMVANLQLIRLNKKMSFCLHDWSLGNKRGTLVMNQAERSRDVFPKDKFPTDVFLMHSFMMKTI